MNDNLKPISERRRTEKAPERLYKYFNPARIGILDHWLIRFTQPGALNDPFELRPHIAAYGTQDELRIIAERRWEEYVREQYERLSKGRTNPIPFQEFRRRCEKDKIPMVEHALAKDMEAINKKMAAKIDSMLNESLGILSLCKESKDLLMWAHYAAGHTGFVLELDTTDEFFNQKQPPDWVHADEETSNAFAEEHGWIRKVRYSAGRPSVLVTGLDFSTLLTKSVAWEYEGEYRMLMPLECGLQCLPERQNGYPICLFQVPPRAVARVVLGCNSSDELREKAMQLKEATQTEHIVIQKARIDDKRFELKFETL